MLAAVKRTGKNDADLKAACAAGERWKAGWSVARTAPNCDSFNISFVRPAHHYASSPARNLRRPINPIILPKQPTPPPSCDDATAPPPREDLEFDSTTLEGRNVLVLGYGKQCIRYHSDLLVVRRPSHRRTAPPLGQVPWVRE